MIWTEETSNKYKGLSLMYTHAPKHMQKDYPSSDVANQY